MNLLIKKFPDDLHLSLKRKAEQNGQKLHWLIIQILRNWEEDQRIDGKKGREGFFGSKQRWGR